MSILQPPIYVLSVRSFSDRISHIQEEMGKHNLSFEFIFDYDVDEIDDATNQKYFKDNSDLSFPAKSITLKHIRAWQKALENHHQQILVFEDDVVLSNNFLKKLHRILEITEEISPAYLIFLGGADTKVPKNFFINQSELFELSMPTAEAYITDLTAMKLRLDWLNTYKISLPADHAMVKIDQECSITQYWPKKALVTQGSVFGLFPTTLDKNRRKKSPLLNKLLFEWKKFKRRTAPQTYYDLIGLIRKS